MKVLDLFSGIGGFSLGLERAGMETVAFCEIEEFPRQVLKKHWPNVPIYEDVHDVTKERLESDGITGIDVVTGGFPCQDISVAGNQKGIEGSRSGLWGELCRIIGDIRPSYAIVENVTALISGDNGRWFGKVLGDLAEIGYDCEWHCIPASELGAHHHRDRVWIICYPQHSGRDAAEIRESDQAGNGGNQKGQKSIGEFAGPGNAEILGNSDSVRFSKQNDEREQQGRTKTERTSEAISARESTVNSRTKESSKVIPDAMYKGLQGSQEPRIFGEGRKGWNELLAGRFCRFGEISEIEPTICGNLDGVSNYAHRLKGLGNAVVPQIPELIGRAIMEIHNG